ncbi:MAG TPA: hypothetical protein VN026_01795 [Bacteroidia bacterium]|jgi:hypothetical protein|nr:hypothetical protein [Bacteroidia bacterium]
MDEKINKNAGLKRQLIHSRRLRIIVIGIPLAIIFIAVYKFFTPSQAMAIQLGIYSLAIMFLMYNYRKSDAANIIISEQNEEINRQKHQLEEQKTLVDKAFRELHEKNKEIIDSIHYARRIQHSLLPNENYISKQLNKLMKNS